jgi:hypothetical protein
LENIKEVFPMNFVRKLICWLFALSALFCVWNGYRLILYILHRHDAFQTARSWGVALIMPILATIYFIAWWAIWTNKTSARTWGIVASLTFILLPVWGMFYFSGSLPGGVAVMLAIGIAGVVVFLKRQVGPVGQPSHGE